MSEVFNWAKQFAADNSTQALADLTNGKYNRSTMSLYLNGKYPAGVEKIEAVLRPLMSRRACPFLNKQITADDCKSRQSRPAPHARKGSMYQHYLACQACAHKEAV
jgi:hypothetical protein